MSVYTIIAAGQTRYSGDNYCRCNEITHDCMEENHIDGVRVYVDGRNGKFSTFYASCTVTVTAGGRPVYESRSGPVPMDLIKSLRKQCALAPWWQSWPVVLTLTPNADSEMGLEPTVVEYLDCPIKDLGASAGAVRYIVNTAIEQADGDETVTLTVTTEQAKTLQRLTNRT
jgi:hypothetical protein